MAETIKKQPWLLRMHHRMRVVSFALLFVAASLHGMTRDYTPGIWALLAILLLAYPQALYLCTCRAKNPVQREISNLRIDSLLLGVFIAITGFSLWLSFSAAIGTLTNNTANKGWWGVPETLLALLAGAGIGAAIFGQAFSPSTDWPVALLCIAGLGWYLLSVDNTSFVRNAQLRQTRETLKARETDLVTANETLEENIREIDLLQQQLMEQANRDSLTGLYNRRYLDSTLERELTRCKREGHSLALIMIDIDHFKKINDTYGHQAGDEVLIRFSATLGRMARGSDMACRYGGEEFLLLMPTMQLDIACERAEALRAEFGTMAVSFGDSRIQTTISIGIAVYPEHGKSAEDLIRSADRALYRAKHTGRNRVEVQPIDESTPLTPAPVSS